MANSLFIPQLNHSSATMVKRIQPIVHGMSDYTARLVSAMEDARMSVAAFAKAMGITYQAAKKAADGKTRSLTAANNERAAKLLGVSSAWLATGIGPRSPGTSPQLAHPLSDLSLIVQSVTRLTWEKLTMGDMNERFEVLLPDDALAPDFPKGTVMRFDPKREPRPGWPCVVKDEQGKFYARDYGVAAGSEWTATARARGYAPLSSNANGLELVASMYGVDFS
jgi:hypothetical protein